MNKEKIQKHQTIANPMNMRQLLKAAKAVKSHYNKEPSQENKEILDIYEYELKLEIADLNKLNYSLLSH